MTGGRIGTDGCAAPIVASGGTGNFKVNADGASSEAPREAARLSSDCSTKPSATFTPTLNGRAGLPSTEISAAPC